MKKIKRLCDLLRMVEESPQIRTGTREQAQAVEKYAIDKARKEGRQFYVTYFNREQFQSEYNSQFIRFRLLAIEGEKTPQIHVAEIPKSEELYEGWIESFKQIAQKNKEYLAIIIG